jgi:hypothetical protein
VRADVTITDEEYKDIKEAVKIGEHAQVDRDSCEAVKKIFEDDMKKLKKENIVLKATIPLWIMVGIAINMGNYYLASKTK